MKMKSNTLMKLAVAVVVSAAVCPLAEAKIELPQILSDHMVLQQKSDANLWGKAAPSSKVTVKASWSGQEYSVKSDRNGDWKLAVKTPEAGYTPYSITVADKDGTVTLNDVLVGVVWLCGGQSNMEMPLDGFWACPVEDALDEIALAGQYRDKIRLVKIPKTGAMSPQENVEGSWQVSSPGNTRGFTAAGWYFAKTLNAVLDVPVGLLSCNWGGSAVESWLPEDVVRTYPENTLPTGQYAPKMDPDGGYNCCNPYIMYNGMICPVHNYTIDGYIWYQGETNAGGYAHYAERLAKMVSIWRNLWGQGNLPFYQVELAPFVYGGDGTIGARIREAQRKAVDIIPNSGIICTNDLAYPYEYDQIHPCKKAEVGQRLAYLALNRAYGESGLPYEEPVYKSMEIKGSSIELSFYNDYCGFSPWHDIVGFEIAGEDKVFYPAEAVLTGEGRKKVTVSSDKVPAPIAVRYCFKDFQLGNLTGRGELPLVPFRTDDWQ
jgi:sialate O-acetylesterase